MLSALPEKNLLSQSRQGLGAAATALACFSIAAAEPPDPKELLRKFGPPVLWAPKPATPPVVDGKLDDEVWKAATPVALSFSIGTWWDAPTQKTEARVLADEQAVYLAARCFEAEPGRIVSSDTTRNGWMEGDTLEFFLDPGHAEKSGAYFHLIVNPKGTLYKGRGMDPKGWTAEVTAKTGVFEGGWSVEAAVPMKDLGLAAGQIPKLWGLNVCRQRPELGCGMPKAAQADGKNRFAKALYKLDEPEQWRRSEHTCWAPTMAEFSGYPFYKDSRPFHFPRRFGHAALEAGQAETPPPEKLFEVLFKSDFDDGQTGPFKGAEAASENFRGPGKCLKLATGQRRVHFEQALENLEDVTLLFAFKLPAEDARLYVTGKAPDDRNCGPERYDYLISKEEADARTRWLEATTKEKYGATTCELYDTHADMIRCKPAGRVRKGPADWDMVEGYFAEPSACQVRWPGQDWVVVRILPGLFRRDPGPNKGQQLVPRDQNYPGGLFFGPGGKLPPGTPLLLDEFVLFRGADVEPPERVAGVAAKRNGEDVEISWNRARDNTLTVFYRVHAGTKLLAETHRLTTRFKAADAGQAPLTVTACDWYGNASEPSEQAAPNGAGR